MKDELSDRVSGSYTFRFVYHTIVLAPHPAQADSLLYGVEVGSIVETVLRRHLPPRPGGLNTEINVVFVVK